MENKSYKESVIEQIMMKVNETIAYATNGECGGRTIQDCKNELEDFISKALEEQMKEVRETVEKERETWARESIGEKAVISVRTALKEKGLI